MCLMPLILVGRGNRQARHAPLWLFKERCSANLRGPTQASLSLPTPPLSSSSHTLTPAGPQRSRNWPKKRRTAGRAAGSFFSPSSCFSTESVTTRNTWQGRGD